jgi:hypothetical protein
MVCMSLLTPTVTMATTQFTRESLTGSALWREQSKEAQPLLMNWVVVTGGNDRRSLRMQWLHSGIVTHRLSTL